MCLVLMCGVAETALRMAATNMLLLVVVWGCCDGVLYGQLRSEREASMQASVWVLGSATTPRGARAIRVPT